MFKERKLVETSHGMDMIWLLRNAIAFILASDKENILKQNVHYNVTRVLLLHLFFCFFYYIHMYSMPN